MGDDATNEYRPRKGKSARKPAKDRRGNVPLKKSTTPQRKPKSGGRIASTLVAQKVEWLLHPWVPHGMLTFVAGLPGVGKSTFLSWLAAQAGRSCFLPGYEEIVEINLLPRLSANGADLDSVEFLDHRKYTLPKNANEIAKELKSFGAKLLVIDPLDSYMDDDKSENSAQDVREFLESVQRIAAETGVAVAGVRHPGKDRTNVMPGSRNWRAVPRVILELASDGATPEKFLLRHYKNSLGPPAKARYYSLVGEENAPRQFQLGEEVCLTVVDLAAASDGPTGRRKLKEACRLLKHMFEEEANPSVQEYVNSCNRLGIGEKARDEAKRILLIWSVPSETRGVWVLKRFEEDWPDWLAKDDETMF